MKCVGLMILFLHWSLSDAQRFQLKGPDDVVADSGSDIILSCSLNTRESAVNMEVTWSRSDLNNRVVHHYKDQQDMNSEQDPSYRNRTSLFKEKLKNGNTSLLLRNVQRSDEGTYKCEVQDKGSYDILTITVTVADPGKYPVITVLGRDDSGLIQLQCETKGWSVEPKLQWMDSGGRELPAGAPRRDPEGYNLRLPLTVFGNDTYVTCQVKDHPSMKAEMDISDIGTIPEITILSDYVSNEVHLLCETKSWKSKPDLEWVDSEGRELPVGDTEKHKDKELYTVRHTITTSHSGTKTFICRVKQHPRMHAKINLGQFSNPSKTSAPFTIILTITLLCVIVVVGGLTGCAYHKGILCFKSRAERQIKDNL